MAIDLSRQKGLNLRQAAKHFSSYRDDKPCHVSRVLRHILRGTLVPGGRRIYLDGLNLGGQWITTLEAIQEYGELVAAAKLAGYRTQDAPATSARSRSAQQVGRELDVIGI